MKVRKLAVALALAGGLGSGVAQALGLGEIELQSYLNEPLDAQIVLPQSRGVNPNDVFVNVAPEAAYERVGLDRNLFLSKLRFQVITGSDGSLIVNISSREPLREPYLNFLLELTWPSGRLMREYAVLVDPPVYAEESGVQETVSAPAAAPASTPASTTSQREPARSVESVRRQAEAEQSLGRGYQADTFGPTGPSDTLWTIASRVRPNDSVSMQQVMLALQDLNPNAFIGGNINRLKRGEVLRIPSIDQIQSRTRAQATRAVTAQNEEFQSPKRTVDATPSVSAESQASAPAETSGGGDELKLLVADSESDMSADSGSAGGDSDIAGGVDAGSAVAMEELDSARRENEELSGRVEDLQDQVETLQRLLELKNSQLAEMQQRGAETEEMPAADTADGGAAMAEDGPDAGMGDDASGVPADAAQDDAAMEGTAEEAQPGAEVGAESGMVAEESSADMAGGDMAAVDSEEGGMDQVSAEPETMEEPVAEAEEPAAVTEPAQSQAQPTTEQSQPAPKPAPQAPAAEKSFPGNVIDMIMGNPLYQIALGGGLIVLLLLLLLVARRNANREQKFYEELNAESDEGSEELDLGLDDEAEEGASASDAISEADAYIAYGRHDQAAQTLESAISREPSRTDLRLKLLAVYADSQDRASFEKQFGEVEALDDEDALAQATELKGRLEEAESMPSIDDLESELRSDSFNASHDVTEESEPSSEELLADQFESSDEGPAENEFGDLDSDLTDFDLSDESASEASAPSEDEKLEGSDQDSPIEYDLSDISLDTDETDVTGEDQLAVEGEGESDFGDFNIDLEESLETEEGGSESADADTAEDLGLDLGESLEDTSLEESSEDNLDDLTSDLSDVDLDEGADSGFELEIDESDLDVGELGEEASVEEESAGTEGEDLGLGDLSSEGDMESLDESFLDELDAELDKVAGEDEDLGAADADDSTLEDLELDVSDEDLALMEEFSEPESPASEEETPALDEELGLEDALEAPEEEAGDTESDDLDSGEVPDLGDLDQAIEEPEAEEKPEAGEDVPVASESVEPAAGPSSLDLDESDLGEDDDFDFLAGTDEAATKLDLARAYIEMGDSDGARDILEEVALEGTEEQKAEAQELLKNLS